MRSCEELPDEIVSTYNAGGLERVLDEYSVTVYASRNEPFEVCFDARKLYPCSVCVRLDYGITTVLADANVRKPGGGVAEKLISIAREIAKETREGVRACTPLRARRNATSPGTML